MSVHQKIDQIAEEFEAAWQTGQSPSSTDFAGRIEPLHRQQLLATLIPLDILFIRQRQTPVTADSYSALGAEAIEIASAELARKSNESGFEETIARAPSEPISDDSFSGNASVLDEEKHCHGQT